MKFKVEYTDTFGGEANYSWLRVAHFDAPAKASNSMLIRRAKKALSMSGWPTRTIDTGDGLTLLPQDGAAVLMFVYPEEV
jgi:hypothetical protein